ncbi:serine/threonine-protein kinase [Streptosporangium sp. CA-135522]|uniref:serine/threonine-protein kinase n=1 Tax=Streptosporangium sp. CA-135522 TaxID=3240072 RepID=UPI003D8E5087
MNQQDSISHPASLGPYRIVERLGRGGMGTVYLAEDPAGARVAIKVINAELADDPAFADRFRDEVTAARRVRQFCTAPVLDADLEGDPLYLVTEFVPGPTLAQVGRLSGANLEALAVGVATALTAIHGAGVIHRDLKPANVLLSPFGPRVIDFGIARALDTLFERTATGRIVGTPDYMAPEALRGEPVTQAFDVFSWGCVVAFAATGRAPFGGKTLTEVLYKVAHEPPVLDGLAPGLREAVETALHKDPARRPTAQQLLDHLVGRSNVDTGRIAGTLRLTLLDSAPVAPAGPVAPARERSGGRGPKATAGGRRRAPSPKPRSRWLVFGGAALVLALAAGGAYLWLDDGPPDQAELVFADDFSRDRGWPRDYGGLYGQGQGYYQLTTSQDNVDHFASASVGIVPPKETLLSVKMRMPNGEPDGQAGLYCHGRLGGGADDGYEFRIRRDGRASIAKKVKGDIRDLTLAERIPGYRADRLATLQAACLQEPHRVRLTLWVNGERVVGAVDDESPLKAGAVGLMARQSPGYRRNTVAHFDDFRWGRL